MGFFGARLWEAETGREVLRLPHESDVGGVAFSQDGALIATQTYKNGDPIRLWSTRSGKLVAEVVVPPKSQSVGHFKFSPDGRLLATKVGNEISVWRMTDYSRVGFLSPENPVDSFAFSPDGLLLAIKTNEEGLIWDWAAGRTLIRLPKLKSFHKPFQFTSDSKRLIAVHEDNTVRVWQLSAGDLIADACSRLERNLTPEEWRTYLGNEGYRRTCPGLPVPEK